MSLENNQAGWPPNAETTEWTGMDAVQFAWKIVKTGGFAVVAPLFLAQLLAFLPVFVIGGIQGAHVAANLRAHQLTDPLDPLMLELRAASTVVAWLSFGFIYGGVYRFALAAARGEPRSFGDAFSGGRWFGSSTALMVLGGLVSLPASIVPLAMTAAGSPPALQLPITLALLVPGTLLGLGWCMAWPLIVDRGMGAVDAMKESWRITSGSRGAIFVTFLVVILVAMGGCCLCGIGMPIGMAIAPIAFSFIYLRLTRQAVAATLD